MAGLIERSQKEKEAYVEGYKAGAAMVLKKAKEELARNQEFMELMVETLTKALHPEEKKNRA